MKTFRCKTAVPVLRRATVAALLWAVAGGVGAVDWAAVPATEVAVFYPGQYSWERTISTNAHKGATKIRAGDACTSCHTGEETEIGVEQAKATGFSGRSVLSVQVRVVNDGSTLHWQLSGPLGGLPPPTVAVMLGNDALKTTVQAGCWIACHDDAPGMASDSGQKLGKYLSRSRSRSTVTGGGDSVRPAAELDAALAAGEFLDLIEVERSGKLERGHVLDSYHEKEITGAGALRVEGDRWVAELQRPLAAAGPGEIALEAGKVYHFGIAVRDEGAHKNQHLVSLVHGLSVGSGTANVVAASPGGS